MKDDVISRQAAIEAMKNMYHAAEKWGEEASDDVIKARAESCMASLIEMKMRIEKLPSAQTEIIRCGECKWWKCADDAEIIRYGDCTRPYSAVRENCLPNETWYCADGEREQ